MGWFSVLVTVSALGFEPLPLSVATTDDALSIIYNPAGFAFGRGPNLSYLQLIERDAHFKQAGVAFQAGMGGLYLGLKPFSIGSGLGVEISSGMGLGFDYHWFKEEPARIGAGMIWRPWGFLSLGGRYDGLNRPKAEREPGVGLALRPFGDRFTLSIDGVWVRDSLLPRLGLELEPFDGLLVRAGATQKGEVGVQLGFGFGRPSLGIATRLDETRSLKSSVVQFGYSQEERRSLSKPKGRFLELTLKGRISDQRPGFSLFGARPTRTTWELLDGLYRAAADPGINGLLLRLEAPRLSLAQVQELRYGLGAFEARGKPIVAYAPNYSLSSYYLASLADEVAVVPTGTVMVLGIWARAPFLKGTLEKLGIEPEIGQAGKYKSGGEIFTRESMSEANREQMEALLDDLYNQFLGDVARARGLEPETLSARVDEGVLTPKDAKRLGLVDTLCYYEDLKELVKERYRASVIPERVFLGRRPWRYSWVRPPRIAVIYASGMILEGESETDFLTGQVIAGAETIVQAIESARKDGRVKAVVLRVDSPGGSGVASDLIWRAVGRARKEKPVVVSMGPVAASGGYYIACNSSEIFALPSTITGSIGVLSGKFNLAGLYSRLGITHDVIRRGEHADIFSDLRGFTEEEWARLTGYLQDFYKEFVSKVAEGRGRSYEAIDSVAQGRIWTGNQALKLGLVDSLGGLWEAVERAKALAGVEEAELIFLPRPKGVPFFLRLLGG